MSKLLITALGLFLLAGCGDDNSTNDQGIYVNIIPYRALVDFGNTQMYRAEVIGAENQFVSWRVNGVQGGDNVNGVIDSMGNYTAPPSPVPNSDSVRIEAIPIADTTKLGIAWAVLIDPGKIYVSMLGSDSTGVGSLYRPYRTITKALNRATNGQLVLIGAGEYDLEAGEQFPLIIPAGVTVEGAGSDSTFITGPGLVFDPRSDALVRIHGFASSLEDVHIRTSNSLGVGIWLRPGFQTRLVRNRITGSRIGIFVDGPNLPRPLIDQNRLDFDSIGIVTADTCAPIIRHSTITQCYDIGIDIRDLSRPDLGADDSTGVGLDSIADCGINNHWLIHNQTPNTIMAIGNRWPFPIPNDNDQFIYDDEESGGASGPVMLE